MTDRIKNLGAVITTVFIFIILLWWLVVVARHIGEAPKVNKAGAVTLDVFQRSKDILLVVLPLATTAIGYWLGNQGAVQAQQTAQNANDQAQSAQKDAAAAQAQLAAVVDVSEPNTLAKAKSTHPEAFAPTAPAHEQEGAKR
jgi:hypothetical protein